MTRRALKSGLAALLVGNAALAQQSEIAEPVSVTVRAAPRDPSPGRLTFGAAKAANGAGTQGDPLKVLQSLPGLGRGGPGSDFVAWGAEPRESRLEVDGVEVPKLYHGSGVRSVVMPSLIESLSVTPGAFDVEHGRATGGLVELRTPPLDLSDAHFGANVDTLDASAFAAAPLKSARAAGFAAARYGYVDRWLKGALDDQVRGLYAVPGYWDGSAALEMELPRGKRARLVALRSSDSESFEVDRHDPSRARSADKSGDFSRIYLQYRAQTGEEQLSVTPFVGWDDARQSETLAGRASLLDVRSRRFGLRAQYRSQLAAGLSLTLGLDAVGTSSHVTRAGSLSVPRREGDPYPFGTPPGYGTTTDDFRTLQVGVGSYAKLELRAGPFSIAPALRLEPTLLEASRTRPPLAGVPDIGSSRTELAIEPRVFAEARLSRAARLFAAAGLYHQPPDPADLGARFGNPELELSRAAHVLFGESAELAERTRLELSLFGKWLKNAAVRAPDPTPRLAEALVSSGAGRAYGAQLFVRQGLWHGFSGWLSITLARSERREPGLAYRLSDYDSPLVLALVLEKALGAWRLAARGRYATGSPRTPVIGAYYDVASNSYQPELGATNGARFRNFAQLDLRVDRRFALSERTTLDVYLDLLNVTFRRNQEQLIYASDFRSLGSVSGLPPLAVLGIKVER